MLENGKKKSQKYKSVTRQIERETDTHTRQIYNIKNIIKNKNKIK